MSKKKSFAYVYGLFILLFGAAVIMCLFSSELQSCAVDTLFVCARYVIPSLFPFMVISSMLTESATYLFGGIKGNIPVIGLPFSSILCFILGGLCGFPVGVVCTSGLLKNKMITEKQAERIASVSNNTGISFVIEVIGGSFWGSRKIGLSLYLIQILSSLLLGTVMMLLFPTEKNNYPISNSKRNISVGNMISLFCDSVKQSSLGVIFVCGFIVFFSVFLRSVFLLFCISALYPSALLSSLTEFTSGCRLSAQIGGKTGIMISAFSIGFGGLSVMAQGSIFAVKSGFSMRCVVIFKFIQGIICSVFAYFLI